MITPQLLDYIRKKVEVGVSQENISQALRTSGWNENDIIQAFNTINGVGAKPQTDSIANTNPPVISSPPLQTVVPQWTGEPLYLLRFWVSFCLSKFINLKFIFSK